MRKFRLVLILLAFSVSARAQDVLQEVMVNPGDTMWDIANKYLKDPQKWPEIVKVNDLPTSDPTIALPGSKIKIPVTLIKEEYRTAQLITMIPEVRYKRKEDTDFKTATTAMTLRYEDSLRTMKGAQARVKFPSREVVQINENSYVVLRPEKILQEIQLMQGDIRASRAKVIMPGGTVVKPQGNNSEYQAKVREDESEVVFVYKGEVNVTAQGKTVKVKQGFGTQVLKSAPPIEPLPLSNFKDFNPADMGPDISRKAVPQSGDKPIKFTPPSITFKENDPAAPGKAKSVVSQKILVSYHLQLAKDEKFQQIIMDKTEPTGTAFDIKKQSVPDGTYYMRVAFMDALGVQGPYSAYNMIVKDSSPPELSEIGPADGAQFQGPDATCQVTGRARDAVLVAVNDGVVFLSQTGRFDTIIHLKPGPNKLTIRARDGSGNETVVTRSVVYSK